MENEGSRMNRVLGGVRENRDERWESRETRDECDIGEAQSNLDMVMPGTGRWVYR